VSIRVTSNAERTDSLAKNVTMKSFDKSPVQQVAMG